MRYILLLITIVLTLTACNDETSPKGNPYSTADKEPSKGGQLFNSYCVQCHGLENDKIGPALKGAIAHWDNDTARIRAFIINARESIESGDPRAVKIANDYNHALMTPMPHLSDADVNAILEYIAE